MKVRIGRYNAETWTEVTDKVCRQWVMKQINSEFDYEKKKSAAATAVSESFPGSIVVSLLKENVSNLYTGQYKYLITRKMAGVRHVCFWTIYETVPTIFYIDRAVHMYKCENIVAPQSFYQGSIFDGELMWNHKRHWWEYHIFDCIQMNGVNCREEAKTTRVQIAQNNMVIWYYTLYYYFPNHLYRILHYEHETVRGMARDCYATFQKRWLIHVANCPLIFWVKPDFHIWQINDLPSWSDEIKNDGYIFTPNEMPVFRGYCVHLIKLKFGFDNTNELEMLWVSQDQFVKDENTMLIPVPEDVRRQIMMETHICLLYTYEFLENTKVGEPTTKARICTAVHYPKTEWEPEFTKYEDMQRKIFECYFDAKTQHWKIMGHRKDHTYANAMPTVQKTLRNIKENLQLTDVFPFLLSSKYKTLTNHPPCLQIRPPALMRSLHEIWASSNQRLR